MNHTENYDLTQWEKSDRIMMEDFNSDNAKIDAALARLDAASAMLERLASDTAYHVGLLGLMEVLERKKSYTQSGFLWQAFLSTTGIYLTGGAAVSGNRLTLAGPNQTGSMTTDPLSTGSREWITARLWIHYDRGTVVPTLNGQAMTRVGVDIGSRTPTGETCNCAEYVCTGPAKTSALVKLELDTGINSSMTVYNYFIALA